MKRVKGILMVLIVLIAMVVITGCTKKEEVVENDTKVVVEDKEDKKETTIVGTLIGATTNTIEIKTNDGTELSFSTENAEMEFKNGIEEGHWVAVTYTGAISGTDTSKAKVIKVVDEGEHIDAEKSKMNIKAVDEEVYATAGVHIRASYTADSEIIGSLAKGASIKRTGVCDNGWSRVEFNGGDAYIYGDYLTTTAPAPTAPPATAAGAKPSTPQTGNPENSQPKPKPKEDPNAQKITLETVVVDVQMGLLTVNVNNKNIIFDISDAHVTSKNGIKDGNKVTIVYTGDLNDMDNVKVISVTDDDPNVQPALTTTAGPQTEDTDSSNDAPTNDASTDTTGNAVAITSNGTATDDDTEGQ